MNINDEVHYIYYDIHFMEERIACGENKKDCRYTDKYEKITCPLCKKHFLNTMDNVG